VPVSHNDARPLTGLVTARCHRRGRSRPLQPCRRPVRRDTSLHREICAGCREPLCLCFPAVGTLPPAAGLAPGPSVPPAPADPFFDVAEKQGFRRGRFRSDALSDESPSGSLRGPPHIRVGKPGKSRAWHRPRSRKDLQSTRQARYEKPFLLASPGSPRSAIGFLHEARRSLARGLG
jgi:hypothetical protein